MLSLLGALLGLSWSVAPPSASAAPGAQGGTATTTTTVPPPPAQAELLVDVGTGRVLFAQHDHTPLPPASLTKVLTAMIAVDWLPKNAMIPVSVDAANVTPDRVGMKPGQMWALDITLHALLIDSANDSAYALAERVSGSLAGFARTMQYAATEIGMRDHPVLHDPAGLDGSEGVDGGNRISAWDLAIAARDLMANPELAAVVGTKVYRFTGPDGIVYSLDNHNLDFLNSYAGAIGVKTGYTDAAGLCVIAEAERGGRRMLAVVLNSTNPDADADALLNAGFATAAAKEPTGAPVLPPVAEPEPPVPLPPTRSVQPIDFQAAPATSVPAAAPGPGRSLASSYGFEAAVGAAIVGGALLSARGFRRRRRSHGPIGRHSQIQR